MTERDRARQEDEVEIDHVTIDVAEGEDPNLGGEIARHLIRRLGELLEDM
jgi:hypothetical protein